ncbi:GPW/gp25 family protein [Streptosporangium canum]|uniref:GPW/gp25 family protein n=1 Tax=Streptosporangium canum TaxID=324952 RepID=UPI0033B35717
MNVGFPYRFDATGRTATVDDETHVRDLIAQVLFTAPGERVMRPDFGSGLLALTFEPNSLELVATTQFLVQGALQQWLGHLIAVEAVEVSVSDGALRVLVQYVLLRTQQHRVDEFAAPGAPA